MSKSSLYDQDFLQWTQQQAECLRKGRWAKLDVENLVEELEALGRSEQKELGSYLQVLLMHLLKYQHQPEQRTKSWTFFHTIPRRYLSSPIIKWFISTLATAKCHCFLILTPNNF